MKRKLLVGTIASLGLLLGMVGCNNKKSDNQPNENTSQDSTSTGADQSSVVSSQDSTSTGDDQSSVDSLKGAKETAIAGLKTYIPESGKEGEKYQCSKENLEKWDATEVYNTAVTEINAAKTQDEIDAAVNKYHTDIKAKLCDYKINGAKKSLNNKSPETKGLEGLTQEEIKAIVDPLITELDQITETEPSDVQSKINAVFVEFDNAVKAKQLEKAKASATAEIDSYKATEIQALTDSKAQDAATAKTTAKQAVTDATTSEAVTNALNSYKQAIDALLSGMPQAFLGKWRGTEVVADDQEAKTIVVEITSDKITITRGGETTSSEITELTCSDHDVSFSWKENEIDTDTATFKIEVDTNDSTKLTLRKDVDGGSTYSLVKVQDPISFDFSNDKYTGVTSKLNAHEAAPHEQTISGIGLKFLDCYQNNNTYVMMKADSNTYKPTIYSTTATSYAISKVEIYGNNGSTTAAYLNVNFYSEETANYTDTTTESESCKQLIKDAPTPIVFENSANDPNLKYFNISCVTKNGQIAKIVLYF